MHAMRTALAKTLIVSVCIGAASAIAMGGCSDDDNKASSTSREAGPFCPATLAIALDSKTSCLGEGFECPIGYSCGATAQQAICRCTKGKFVCSNGRGEDVDDAEKPPCTAQGAGNEKECPASQNGTDTTTCHTPGLQCFYQGFTCPESPDAPKVDVCQCVSGSLPDGGAALQFRCEINYCHPKADASIPVFDAGHD
jgi:hypothetical protein